MTHIGRARLLVSYLYPLSFVLVVVSIAVFVCLVACLPWWVAVVLSGAEWRWVRACRLNVVGVHVCVCPVLSACACSGAPSTPA